MSSSDGSAGSETAWHRLNPLTKAVVAVGTTAAVLLLGGYLAPLALLAIAVVPGAMIAQVGGRVIRAATLAMLPIAIAVALVSTFGLPGETVLFRFGPLAATLEGFDAAAQVTVRLFVMAAAITLFGLTTSTRAFVVDLERRGVSPRFAFAASATFGAVPALVEHAQMVRDAQRARGLDIDGDVRGRLRGVLPLFGPVVIGTLHAVEARSLALEVRAFGRPGRRDLLWAPSDPGWERAVRWLIVAAVLAIAIAVATGATPRLP